MTGSELTSRYSEILLKLFDTFDFGSSLYPITLIIVSIALFGSDINWVVPNCIVSSHYHHITPVPLAAQVDGSLGLVHFSSATLASRAVEAW